MWVKMPLDYSSGKENPVSLPRLGKVAPSDSEETDAVPRLLVPGHPVIFSQPRSKSLSSSISYAVCSLKRTSSGGFAATVQGFRPPSAENSAPHRFPGAPGPRTRGRQYGLALAFCGKRSTALFFVRIPGH